MPGVELHAAAERGTRDQPIIGGPGEVGADSAGLATGFHSRMLQREAVVAERENVPGVEQIRPLEERG